MNKFQDILGGGDLRSIGKANEIISIVNTQSDFDELFTGLKHSDRLIVMRTADAIEKITIKNPVFLQKHKKEILNLCSTALDIEFKWHLALLVSRISLTESEFVSIWNLLSKWATDRKESKIVRVNSIQGLYNMLSQKKEYSQNLITILSSVSKEKIPSLDARIKKLKFPIP